MRRSRSRKAPPKQYFQLYNVTVEAIRSVDPALRVGGPASAAAGWVEQTLGHADASGAALDFVSTHTYGSPPLDLRPLLLRHGRAGTPLWWTEWGVSPAHFDSASDSVFGAAFLLRGMTSAMGRIEAVSYWVIPDHFEELGRPPALLHGGFGLRTVGNLRKPRWWALELLERLGPHRLGVTVTGDGGGSLVEAVAARRDDGTVGVLVWNGTLHWTKAGGDDALARHLVLRVAGLDETVSHLLRHFRVDATHSNITSVWESIGGGADWPNDDQWDALRRADQLDALHSPRSFDPASERAVDFDLPMPGISYLEFSPQPWST